MAARQSLREGVFLCVLLAILLSAIAAPVAAAGELAPSWNYPTGSEIKQIAISTDGLYFAVGSTDHTVYYFTRDGKLMWSYITTDVVNTVATSADGQFVAAGAEDGKIYYFARDGKLLWSQSAASAVRSVAVSGNAQFVAAGSRDHTIMGFSQDGTRLWSFTAGNNVNSVAISSDGKDVIAGAWDKNIYYFGSGGSLLWTFATGADEVSRVFVSSDGQIIAATSADNTIYYLTGKGRLLWSYAADSIVSDIAMSKDGQYIAAGTLDQQVYFLNRDGKLLWNYGVGNIVKSVAISDNGLYVVAGSQGNKVYSFLNNGTLLWSSTASGPIGEVAISGNGKYVVAGSLAGIVYKFDNLAAPQPVQTSSVNVPGIPTRFPLPYVAGGVLIVILIAVAAFHVWRIRRHTGNANDVIVPVAARSPPRPLEKIPPEWWERELPPESDIRVPILDRVVEIAAEISREGREGKSIGTAFLVGDAENVMDRSRQLIKNPVEGHAPEDRLVTNQDQEEYIKEMSQLDGVFVISGDGLIEAVGRRITVDTSDVHLPDGYGTRHASVAGMTQATHAIGVVVSQSGGKIAIFRNGRIIRVLEP